MRWLITPWKTVKTLKIFQCFSANEHSIQFRKFEKLLFRDFGLHARRWWLTSKFWIADQNHQNVLTAPHWRCQNEFDSNYEWNFRTLYWRNLRKQHTKLLQLNWESVLTFLAYFWQRAWTIIYTSSIKKTLH